MQARFLPVNVSNERAPVVKPMVAAEEKQVQAIAFEYPCYICKEIFTTPIDVKSHVICVHHYCLPETPPEARPVEEHFEFKELPRSEEDAKDIMIHSACPSCWFHCPAQNSLALEVHIVDVHDPPCSESTRGQERAGPTVKDLYDKLEDLGACLREYLGRE
ncbi:hypothetical protein MBANPS3_002112 [Mucor bainieri]